MPKGLVWVGANQSDSGKVVVLLDGGRQKLLPAAQYVVSGVKPPLYELPRTQIMPEARQAAARTRA